MIARLADASLGFKTTRTLALPERRIDTMAASPLRVNSRKPSTQAKPLTLTRHSCIQKVLIESRGMHCSVQSTDE
eukprot:1225963-Pleurochrysis_carterae.AAC.1